MSLVQTGSLASWAAGLLAAVALLTIVWVASLARRDASLVDRFWGIGFAAVGAVWFWRERGFAPRAVLALALVALWGARLSLHIARRNWGRGEDRRYVEMRERGGPAFPWKSLATVHWLQAGLLAVVALPLWKAIVSPLPAALGPLDCAGAVVALAGLACEATADRQLARFRADAASRGRVMDRGLWRYSRHPNYFGDALFWWGIALLSLATPDSFGTLAGPVLMTFLLVRVSGVALLEKNLLDAKPGYRDYVARTSSFLPLPPKREPPPDPRE